VEPVTYRLAPAVVARFVGLAFVVLAVLLFAGTAVVALAGLGIGWLLVVVLVLVVAAFGTGFWLRDRAYVLRCTDDGYRVGLVRGAGVTEARWKQVEDLTVTVEHDVPCVRMYLRDGRTTTLPASLLATDREQLVRDLQRRLRAAQGLRPLNP
jgi:hypothetical protein